MRYQPSLPSLHAGFPRWAPYLLALLLAISGLLVLAGVLAYAVTSQPVTQDAQIGHTRVQMHADRDRVTFPGECVTVAWETENASRTAFFKQVEPGIPNGSGTRLVFFQPNYQPATLPAEAPGAQIEDLDGSKGPVQRSQTACIDLHSEPKLRVYAPNGQSQAFTLDIDIVFLRVETWGLLFLAGMLIFGADYITNRTRRQQGRRAVSPGLQTTRAVLVLSLAIMVLYYFLARHVDTFLSVYWLETVILSLLTALILAGLGLLLAQPSRAESLLATTQAFMQRVPRLLVWLAIIAFWLLILSFGYESAATLTPFMWLPLYLWALGIGAGVLWAFGRPTHSGKITRPPTSHRNTRRGLLLLVVGVMMLALLRDVLVLQAFSIRFSPDTSTILKSSETLLQAPTAASTQPPQHALPYLLMNGLSASHNHPLPLIWLQFLIGAAAIALLVGAVYRNNRLLAVLIGLFLALDFSWGAFNRAILTDGPYASFQVIGLSILIWHYRQGPRLRWWLLAGSGFLLGWILLFRGVGLPLVGALFLLYWAFTGSARKAFMLVGGILVFFLAVALFNGWRYGSFQVFGEQHNTLASAAYSYHLFEPENGPASAEVDAALRDCLPYLDYDDVPRYDNTFIYHHYNRCLLPKWGRDKLTDTNYAVLQEIIRQQTFDYARVLVEEVGTFLQTATGEATAFTGREYSQENCLASHPALCDALPHEEPVVSGAALTDWTQDQKYLRQAYLLVGQLSTVNQATGLAAWLMLVIFLLLTTCRAVWFMVAASAFYIVYHALTTSAVHVFAARYVIPLSPFQFILSVTFVAVIGQEAWFLLRQQEERQTLRQVPALAVACLTVILLAPALLFGNDRLRRHITLPAMSAILPDDTNPFRKYGLDDLDYRAYQEWPAGESNLVFSPTVREWQITPLQELGRVKVQADLSDSQQDLVRRWRFNQMPGYLQAAGIDYLYLDETNWPELNAEGQAIINNPQHYRLIGKWSDVKQEVFRRLYAVVGDATGPYPLYQRNGIVLFEQPDRALHLLRLDENGNGVFVARIEPGALTGERIEMAGANGWQVVLEHTGGRYRLEVFNSEDKLVDSGFMISPEGWQDLP